MSLAEALQLTHEARCITTASAPYDIVHVNRAWTRITGWKFAEAVGKSADILQGPDTQREALDVLRSALSGPSPEPITVQLINYTFQGVPFNNTLRIHPIRNKEGLLTNFSATIDSSPVLAHPVTPLGLTVPRQLAEKRAASRSEASRSDAASTASWYSEESMGHAAKRQATGRLRRAARHMDLSAALSSTEDAVVLLDVREPHRILHVNKAWSGVCGFTMDEAEGATDALLEGPETDRALLDDMMRSVRRGESSSATVYSYCKGGGRFLAQVQVAPIWEGGRIVQLMGLMHEVATPAAAAEGDGGDADE